MARTQFPVRLALSARLTPQQAHRVVRDHRRPDLDGLRRCSQRVEMDMVVVQPGDERSSLTLDDVLASSW